ncbi:MAG TPA: MFS transporter [Chloroflexia bacterium]|nr:MFS transporter [Chloroflexia bacterium]
MSETSSKPLEVAADVSTVAARHVTVGLLGAAAFVVTADVRVVNPLLHIIAQEFKTDVGSTGFIVTAYTIPYGLFQLVYGPLGDRLGKLRVMTVALALFAFGTAACAIAPSLAILDLLRFLTGVAAAAIIPMSLAYIGDNFPYQERQAAIGQFLAAVALGNILSTSLGGIAGDFLNWRFIFLLYGLASLVVLVFVARAARKQPPVPAPAEPWRFSQTIKPYFSLIRQPGPRLLYIAVFLEGFFFFGGFSYLGAFLRDTYNLLYLVIGFMLSGFGVGSLIYSRSVKWLVKRFGENGLIMLGGGVTFASYLLIALLQLWPLFIPLNITMGLGYYMCHSTLQTKATELAPGMRGTAVSLFAFNLFLGQGIGAWLLGAIVDGPGYVPAFLISGIGMGALGVWIVSRTRKLAAAA